MLFVASTLDPRRKFECMSFYFETLCKDYTMFKCEWIGKILKDLINKYETVHVEKFPPFSPLFNSNNIIRRQVMLRVCGKRMFIVH